MAAADFDIITVYPVITDFQLVKTGALPFACFQLYQILIGMPAEIAQLIELIVIMVGNNAAIANQCRRGFDQSAAEQIMHLRMHGYALRQLAQQCLLRSGEGLL